MRYVVDFGTANAGGAPVFTTFDRLDTLAAIVPTPTITDMGDGQYYFDVDWSATTATSIAFKVTLAGIELSDVISSPDVLLPGATTASAGVSSLVGYSTAGVLVARAMTLGGWLNLNAQQQAAYDPFASTDPMVVQALEVLNVLGAELVGIVNGHLRRDVEFVTAGSAESYALPADYSEMVPNTQWDRSGGVSLAGPVSGAYSAYLKGSGQTSTVRTPFRIQGNRITFPVVPADGLSFSAEYISEYWVQTAASGTGPDADHVTSATDYVLFDPLLIVLGLKLKMREIKGMDTSTDVVAYADRLERVKGKVASAPTLSISGRRSGPRFLSEYNIPDTGYLT